MAAAANLVKVTDSTSKGKDFLPGPGATQGTIQQPTNAANSGTKLSPPSAVFSVTSLPITSKKG